MCKHTTSSIGKAVFYPFTRIGNKVHRKAVVSTRFLPKEIKSTVEEYQAHGDDFTADLSRKYWRIQSMCFGYRVLKLKDELIALTQYKMSDYDHTHLVLFIRWCIRLLFLFMVGLMMGRQSVYPLVRPTSPFVQELKKQYDV